MTLFLAEKNAVTGFYDSALGPVPDGAVQLTDAEYQAFLAANGQGASLAIRDGKAAALDWQGNEIDLATVKPGTSYTKPPALADLAQAAFQKARQQFQDLQMVSQGFGPVMQKYMQALNAIITGTDTTSTALPTPPADPTQ